MILRFLIAAIAFAAFGVLLALAAWAVVDLVLTRHTR